MVKRWDASGVLEVEECKTGDFVLHSDYAALQASHARLLEAAERISKFALYSPATMTPDRAEAAIQSLNNLSAAIAAARQFEEK